MAVSGAGRGRQSPGPCRLVSHSLLVPRTAATGPGAASTCSFCRSALVLAAARLCVDRPPPRQAPGRPCSPPGKEHRQRVKTSPKSKPLDFQNGFIVLGVRVCFFPQVLPVTERKRKIPSPSSIWFSDSKSKVWCVCGGGIPGGCEGPQRPLCVRSGARSRSHLGPGPQHS